MSSLIRIVPWSQQLACEVLLPGDKAVDLTAGKGRDTLALARAVGKDGQVIALDSQKIAIEQTTRFLAQHGVPTTLPASGQAVSPGSGVYLVETCHSNLSRTIQFPVKVIMANLGYLPGGDQALITTPDTTFAALSQSIRLLEPGGRLAVTVYPAHPGGEEEGAAVNDFFCNLSRDNWLVLALRVANQAEAPFLYVAESVKQP